MIPHRGQNIRLEGSMPHFLYLLYVETEFPGFHKVQAIDLNDEFETRFPPSGLHAFQMSRVLWNINRNTLV